MIDPKATDTKGLPTMERFLNDLSARQSRELCRGEVATQVGEEQAVRPLFVTQMLTALACDYALKASERARIIRTPECKKEMQRLPKWVEEYQWSLGKRLKSREAGRAYNDYLKMFDTKTVTQQYLTELQGQVDAKNQQKIKDPEVCAYVTIALSLLKEMERYRYSSMLELSRATGSDLCLRALPMIERMKADLNTIASLGYASEPTEHLKGDVRIICNQAHFLVGEVLEREDAIWREKKMADIRKHWAELENTT